MTCVRLPEKITWENSTGDVRQSLRAHAGRTHARLQHDIAGLDEMSTQGPLQRARPSLEGATSGPAGRQRANKPTSRSVPVGRSPTVTLHPVSFRMLLMFSPDLPMTPPIADCGTSSLIENCTDGSMTI
jgi:hypothetical protein